MSLGRAILPLGLSSLLSFSLLPSLAHGAPPGQGASPETEPETAREQVWIRVSPARADVHGRVEAELGLIDFDAAPLEIEADAGTLGPDLLDHLAGGPATAAIEIILSEDRVDLWVADAQTGKVLNRRLDPGSDARTVAIAAVELLRASRLEIEGRPAPELDPRPDPDPEPEPEPEPQPDPEPEPERPLLGSLGVAPVLTGSAGGLGPTAHIEIGGRWRPNNRLFALRSAIWVPTLGNRIADDRGVARVFIGMLFVEPQIRVPTGVPWFHPVFGLGVGGAVIGIVGEAAEDSGVRSNRAVLGSFIAHGHTGFGFAVSNRVWLRLDGYLGIAQPRARVLFVDDVVASWGLPWGGGSLGVEIWL